MIQVAGAAIGLSVLACACMGIITWSATSERDAALSELSGIRAVAAAADARHRKLEAEVADAQKGYVEAWRRERDAAAGEWVRLEAQARRSRVPAVCAEPGSPAPDRGDGVEGSGTEGGGGLLEHVVFALKTGAALEATLALCQSELRRCADVTGR